MQEVECQSGIDVTFRARKEGDVVVSGVDEADTGKLDNRRLFGGLGRDNFIAEIHDLISAVKHQQMHV